MIKRSLQIFRGKNCMVIVYLLYSPSMQKKSADDFFILVAPWSIFAWISAGFKSRLK